MEDKKFVDQIPCRNFQIWKIGHNKTVVILLNVAPVKLNTTAAFIWRRCNGRTKIRNIIQSLSKEYPSIPKSRLLGDAKEFIQSAEQAGLLLGDWNTF